MTFEVCTYEQVPSTSFFSVRLFQISSLIYLSLCKIFWARLAFIYLLWLQISATPICACYCIFQFFLSYISSGCKYLRYAPAIVSYFRALFASEATLGMHGMGFRLLQYIKVLEIKRARIWEREFYIYCILQINPWDECHWTGWEDKILFQCPLLSRKKSNWWECWGKKCKNIKWSSLIHDDDADYETIWQRKQRQL